MRKEWWCEVCLLFGVVIKDVIRIDIYINAYMHYNSQLSGHLFVAFVTYRSVDKLTS